MGQEIIFLIAKLGAPSQHEFLKLGADSLVDRRGHVAVKRLTPDLGGPGGRVVATFPGPAFEVLGRGQERSVEALAKALERVCRAKEMSAGPDLLMSPVGQ